MEAIFGQVRVEHQLLFGQHLDEPLQKTLCHTLAVSGPFCLLQVLVGEFGVQAARILPQKNSEDVIVEVARQEN